MKEKLAKTLDNATLPHNLPKNLRFLEDGYHSDLVPEELTLMGRKQLFDHGVEYVFFQCVELGDSHRPQLDLPCSTRRCSRIHFSPAPFRES